MRHLLQRHLRQRSLDADQALQDVQEPLSPIMSVQMVLDQPWLDLSLVQKPILDPAPQEAVTSTVRFWRIGRAFLLRPSMDVPMATLEGDYL